MTFARIRLIINPVAGACKQAAALRELVGRLRQTGSAVDVQSTRGPGDATRLAREAATLADLAIVAGGDGTVCEAANGLIGTDTPLIIWPTGTENLVAKSLGFRPTVDATLAAIAEGTSTPLDLGVANGKVFLVVAGAGFDAEVVHRLVSNRRGHITHLSYAIPVWRTFMEHRFPRFKVFTEGRLYWEGQGLVFLGNMSRYALGLQIARDARPDDGLLDLCIFACRDRRQLIAHSIRTVLGRHVEHADVRYARVRQVRVEAAGRVPFEMDGELAGVLPLEAGIRPAAIRVQIPPPSAKS